MDHRPILDPGRPSIRPTILDVARYLLKGRLDKLHGFIERFDIARHVAQALPAGFMLAILEHKPHPVRARLGEKVMAGRGASAVADWSANKQLTLPNKRGYIVGGLPDMGNTDSGDWSNAPLIAGAGATTAGGSRATQPAARRPLRPPTPRDS